MEKIISNGKEITVRKLAEKDLRIAKKHLDYFDALLDENLYISSNKRLSLKKEKEYLKNLLAEQKRRNCVYLVSEFEGKIISHAESRLMEGKQNHISVLGIAIANGFRRIGLGSMLMKELISLTIKNIKPKPLIIQSGIFPENTASLKLHRKFGFKKAASIPNQLCQNGKLTDEIIVQLYL